jgi:NAD(P)H-flavin reductase
VDLYPPAGAHVLKPGGFTITSSPTLAQQLSPPNPTTTIQARSPPAEEESGTPGQQQHGCGYIELAIQASPLNPAAAYLFRPTAELLRTEVQVRIGGSFTFPPPPSSLNTPTLLRKKMKIVFVAGGMGINPLMSMLSWLGEQANDDVEQEVWVLYSVKDPAARMRSGGGGGSSSSSTHGVVVRKGEEILFLERIAELFSGGSRRLKGGLRLFLTGSSGDKSSSRNGGDVVKCADGTEVPFLRRRMTVKDVEDAVGSDKEDAVVYVCGMPAMTDEFVQALVCPDGFGMDQKRVLFEKWW